MGPLNCDDSPLNSPPLRISLRISPLRCHGWNSKLSKIYPPLTQRLSMLRMRCVFVAVVLLTACERPAPDQPPQSIDEPTIDPFASALLGRGIKEVERRRLGQVTVSDAFLSLTPNGDVVCATYTATSPQKIEGGAFISSSGGVILTDKETSKSWKNSCTSKLRALPSPQNGTPGSGIQTIERRAHTFTYDK